MALWLTRAGKYGEHEPRFFAGSVCLLPDLLYSFGASMTVCRVARIEAEARVRAMPNAGLKAQAASAWEQAQGQKAKQTAALKKATASCDALLSRAAH